MSTEEVLNYLISYAYNVREEVCVVFLANVRDLTPNENDYFDTSILTEFLDMNEYNELVTSLQNFGFYTLTFFDINEFIHKVMEEEFKFRKLVIFEGTQKGIGRGKDSFLPSFCDLENLIHTGPNAYVNAICSNKYHWTKLLENHNISVPSSWRYYNKNWLNNQKPSCNIKLIAKPIYECASIGIQQQSVAQYSSNYEDYLDKISRNYNQPLIVQEFIAGYEVEVPVIIHGGTPYVLPAVVLCQNGQPLLGDSFFDFDSIYEDAYDFCLLRDINSEWCLKVKREVLKIVELLELEQYTRIDFRISPTGKYYVTDINSYPHIVKHSSFAYAFEQLQISSKYIVPCLIGNVLSAQS